MEVDRNSLYESGPSAFHGFDILHSSTWSSGSTIPLLWSLHSPSEIIASEPNSTYSSAGNITDQSNWGLINSSNEYNLLGIGNAQATVPFTAMSAWNPLSLPENLDIPEESQILNDKTYMEDMIQDQYITQEPIRSIGIPSNIPNHPQSLAQTPKTDVATKPFGPSRPISLPPARRGGKKGPLSVEGLQKRRESRKQGVCIRCRRWKSKCHGGFPCEACREKSKAPRWIYPCVKAHFLDIIEHDSYFQNISSFQEVLGDKMSPSLLIEQVRVVMIMSHRNHLSFIT
ncbi:hypothetical protein N431DRAFT_488875, partial [Stipitochalara longipes BDJ]